MKPHRLGAPQALPQTRNDLQLWVREHLELPSDLEAALLEAVDAVFSRHERLWQESKQEAIQAVAAAFSEKMADKAHELNERGRSRQQHLDVFRTARGRPDGQVATRSEDQADELRQLH